MTLRARGKGKPYRGHALPCYSVPKKADGEALQILLCSRDHIEGTYVLPHFGGELEDLYRAGDLFHAVHTARNEPDQDKRRETIIDAVQKFRGY